MMGKISKILLSNLESKGLNEKSVTRVFKDLMLAFSMNPMIDRPQMSNRLQVLGWGEIELDYRTWELAKVSFEMLQEDEASFSPLEMQRRREKEHADKTPEPMYRAQSSPTERRLHS